MNKKSIELQEILISQAIIQFQEKVEERISEYRNYNNFNPILYRKDCLSSDYFTNLLLRSKTINNMKKHRN